jgi:LytS/YehU family sensor histidine kinase
MRFQQGLFLTFSLNHVAIENFQKEAIFRQFPDLDTYPVIPTLLITLLENAFKHGDYSQAAYPIVLDFDCSPQKLTFRISNRKRQLVRDIAARDMAAKDIATRDTVVKERVFTDIVSRERKVSTGIGLENTRKRLEHTYPNRHLFEITEDEHTFSLYLTLFNHS